MLPEGPSATIWATTAWNTTFPVLQVDEVYHRERAIWPFTVVGGRRRKTRSSAS